MADVVVPRDLGTGRVCYDRSVRVAGRVLRSRYLFVKAKGADALARVHDALPKDLRLTMEEGFLETRWYPYSFYVQLCETIDRVLGTGDLALAYEMGRFNCDANLNTAMRLLFKFGDIGWLLERSTQAWRMQFDEGDLAVVRREPGVEVVVELHDHPQPSRAHCLAIKGFMVRAAEVSGEDHFDCVEECVTLGDPVCRWTFTWQ